MGRPKNPDVRPAQLLEHQRVMDEATNIAKEHRRYRDALIRKLRKEDPVEWTQRRLARLLDVSPELIAKIERNSK